MTGERQRNTETEWLARPGLARLVRTVAWLTPLTLAVVVSGVLAQVLPPAQTSLGLAGRWLVLCGVSTVVLIVVDRFARRLLPLAALLRLALVFPDRAPSRYKMARSVATTRQLEAEIESAREFGIVGDRERVAEEVLQLVAALSIHDRATRGHAERVRIFTDMIAEEMGLSHDETARLRWASLLHDVGKIFVPPTILNKPGKPTEQEWEILRTHPLEGARLAAPLHDWMGSWILTIEQHHERWDGGGYPFGLSGQEISLGARIVAVADAFDVMTSARSYKRPMTATAARADLARCAGSQFDPKVVRAFLSLSLSRVRWAVGPLAWLLNLPMVRLVPLPSVTPASAAMPHGMSGMAAVTSTAVAASGIGVVGLPAVSALDFARDAAPAAVSAEAFADTDDSTLPVPGDEPQVLREGDGGRDDVGTLAEAIRTSESSTPDDDGDRALAAEEREERQERQSGREPGASGDARAQAHTASGPDEPTPTTASSPARPEPAGQGGDTAPARPDHAAPKADTAPGRPDHAGPDADTAPARPDHAGPDADSSPPRPDHAGPKADASPPRPEGPASGGGDRPSPPETAGQGKDADARPTPPSAGAGATDSTSAPERPAEKQASDSGTKPPSTSAKGTVADTPAPPKGPPATPGAPSAPGR